MTISVMIYGKQYQARVLRIHPELIETHSWPEMRRMAEALT